MRKPRDIDTVLKALQDKQRSLKLKRITQFDELITATGGAPTCTRKARPSSTERV